MDKFSIVKKSIILLSTIIFLSTHARRYEYAIWANDINPGHAYGDTLEIPEFEHALNMVSVVRLKELKNDTRTFSARVIRFDLEDANSQQGQTTMPWFFYKENSSGMIKLYVAYHSSFIESPVFEYQGIYDSNNNKLISPQKVTIAGKEYFEYSFKPLKEQDAQAWYKAQPK